MTVDREIDSIDRRLEFLKKDFQRGMPTLASRRERPPVMQRSTMTNSQRSRHYVKTGGTIAASKKTRELMRQVSALGMEDPIFGTTEDGPQHPSNIFDDMSLNDVPEDMRDCISIASDPTAEVCGGIDMAIYHTSLGDIHQESPPAFQMMDLAMPSRRLVHLTEQANEEDSLGSLGGPDDDQVDGRSHPTEPLSLEPDEAKGGKQSKRKTKVTVETTPTSSPNKPSEKLLEKLNASINSLPSLSLEDALHGIPSPPQTPPKSTAEEEKLHKSRASVVSATSRTSKTTQTETEESIARKAKRLVCPRRGRGHSSSLSDLKFNVADISPKRHEATDEDMLQVYSRSVQEFPAISSTSASHNGNFVASALHRGDSIYQPIDKAAFRNWNGKRGSLNTSMLCVQPDNLHVPPSQPGIKGDEPLAKSRAMPNISNLFPVDGSASKRIRSRRARQVKANKAAAAAPTTRRRLTCESNVSEITPCTGIDTSSLRAVCSRNTTSVYRVNP